MPKAKKSIKPGRFLSYYGPYRGLFIADLFSAVMVSVLGLVLPLCVRHITSSILRPGAEDILPGILRTGALMLGLIAAMTGFRLFNDYKGHDMGAKIERDLRAELFAYYQELPFGFYDGRNTGELMSRLSSDLYNLSEVYHHVPEAMLTNGIQVIGTLAILAAVDFRLALVVFAALLVMLLYAGLFFGKLQKSYRVNRERMADINHIAQESLSGIRVTKSFANEAEETGKFAAGNERYYRSQSGIYRSEALLYSVVESFFTPLMVVAIATAGGIWITGGSLDIANLLLFIMYAAYLAAPIPGLASLIPFYQQGFAGYSRFREIMDTAPAVADAAGAAELAHAAGHVEFDNVSFRYGGGLEYVLRGVSLEVKPGETVAIAGVSGIGKTTLCALIPRFYDVSGGAVRVDGADVRDLTQASLRRQIGVVRQETFLFSGTVLENILYGRPGASREEAVEAAKKANAHAFILELPAGYDTDIGQRGVKLSGGQQQRLSIARVFLKDPPILLFDEATSALDYESERAVMESLKALARGRTAFIVAHRLSTVRRADRIVVLDGAGIAEQGSHGELMAAGGVYARLYSAQAG